MKYKTKQCVGFWLPTDPTEKEVLFLDVLIAEGSWDEIEDADDSRIFHYMDGQAFKVGDIVSDGFVVTQIN
jgi:hypothetical protein